MKIRNSTEKNGSKQGRPTVATRPEIIQAAVEDYKSGLPLQVIAGKCGVTKTTASLWAKAAGCARRPRGIRSATMPCGRDQRILLRRAEGVPVRQVADEFNLSRYWIYRIEKKWGAWLKPPPPVNGEKAGLLPERPVDVDAAMALPDADASQSAGAVEPARSEPITAALADVGAHFGVSEGTVELEPELPVAPPAPPSLPAFVGGEAKSPDDLEPGPFPIDALSPVMRKVAEETARVHGVAVELPGMAAVATLGGAMGKGWQCVNAVNGRTTYGNLFVIMAAPQSYGKGAAADIIRPLIQSSDAEAVRFTRERCPDLMTELQLLERQRKALLDTLTNPRTCGQLQTVQTREMRAQMVGMEAKIAEIRQWVALPPSYWIGNTSPSALTDHLARNGHTLMSYSPEAGEVIRTVLGRNRRARSADFDLYLSSYSVESYRETRVGRVGTPLQPCLTLFWQTQPSILEELTGHVEAQARGMLARTLLFSVEGGDVPLDDGIRRCVSEDARKGWASLIQQVLTARGRVSSPAVITCSPEAREVFTGFHNELVRLRNGAFRDVEGQLGRWRENAIRIAVGLCVADSYADPTRADEPLTLSADQARQAVRIGRWCGLSGLKVQAVSRRDALREKCDRLCTLLAGQDGGKMTLRDLRDRNGFDEQQIQVVTAAFPERLALREERPATGRPKKLVALLPSRDD